MPTTSSITSALRFIIKSEPTRILALGCIALAALLIGLNVGYFVVLWNEWGAILGGLAVAGSVFLFSATSGWLQTLRVMMFVAGFALAGAGISDLLNFPASNRDVLPGFLLGAAFSLAFARWVRRAGLSLANSRISDLFNPNGALVSLLWVLVGFALFGLIDILKQIGFSEDASFVLCLGSAVGMQIHRLKRRGACLTRGAVWITFAAMLLYAFPITVVAISLFSLSDAASLVFLILLITALAIGGWRYVRGARPVTSPIIHNLLVRQLLTLAWTGAALFPMSYFYSQALDNLELNISPTELIANDKSFLKLDDEAFVRLMMRDVYYWKSKQNVSLNQADTPDNRLEKLANDPWSFAQTAVESNDWEKGIQYGQGVRLVDRVGKFIIGYINHNSPAARAGYERGDQVIIPGKGDTGAENKSLRVLKPSGVAVTATVVSERHYVDTVRYKIIRRDGKNIGYLWLLNFSNATLPAIQGAFWVFKQQGVEEMVLDLRYNGGGHHPLLLGDLIAGERFEGKVYSSTIHSNKYHDRDESDTFHLHTYSIPIKRVFVLTTNDTCSASELIINGLRPYLPVITIGEKTCGKPFFMHPIFYGKNVYSPVAGRLVNAEGKAGYEQGIEPDCKAQEDFSKQVSQPGDKLLDTALYFQKHNACPAKAL